MHVVVVDGVYRVLDKYLYGIVRIRGKLIKPEMKKKPIFVLLEPFDVVYT